MHDTHRERTVRALAERLAGQLEDAASQLSLDYGERDPSVKAYRATLQVYRTAMAELNGQQALALAGQNEEESE